jgi:hypothetical protein
MALICTQHGSQAEVDERAVSVAWIILTRTFYIMHAYTHDISTRRRQKGVDEA